MPTFSRESLTPSELVLLHGQRFAVRKRPIKLTLVCLASSVLCGYLMYSILRAIGDEWASRSWPAVQGTIVSSQVIRDDDQYRADVRFTYEIAGRPYKGDTVAFTLRGLSSGSDSAAKEIVRRYPPGAAVRVTYDPSNSAKGVLEPGLHAISFVILVMVLVPTVFSVAIVMWQLPLLLWR